MMPKVRFRPNEIKDAYLHCFGQVLGPRDWSPLDEECRDHMFSLLFNLLDFYTIEVLSFVVMPNHWQMVCHLPTKLLTLEEARQRWKAYHTTTKSQYRKHMDWNDPEALAYLDQRSRNLSRFLGELERRFTSWFNREVEPGRHGNMWCNHYGSVQLANGRELWECLKHVEATPTRLNLCPNPGDYPHSSWGMFTKTGKHPFAENFFRSLENLPEFREKGWNRQRIAAEFAAEMAKIASLAAAGELVRYPKDEARMPYGFGFPNLRRGRKKKKAAPPPPATSADGQK